TTVAVKDSVLAEPARPLRERAVSELPLELALLLSPAVLRQRARASGPVRQPEEAEGLRQQLRPEPRSGWERSPDRHCRRSACAGSSAPNRHQANWNASSCR